MLIIVLMHIIRGFAVFKIEGADITRIINICAAKRISVWGLKKINSTFYGRTYIKTLESVAQIAKDNGIELVVIKKVGIPVVYNRYKKRTGVFLGIVILILFIMGTQNFIWSVDVIGNNSITSDEVITAVKDAGVSFGTLKSKVNFDDIKTYLMIRFDNISWVAVNIMGTKVHIEISEGDPAPDIISTTDEPRNIVAAKDGIISKVIVWMGQCEIKKGDVVVAGDLLVNGIMEDKKGNNLFRRADGEIYAKTEFTKEFRVNTATKERVYKGDKKSFYKIGFNQNMLPLYFNNKVDYLYDALKIRKKISFLGITLPVNTEEDKHFKFTEQDVKISKQTAINIAKYKQQIYEKSELAKAKILSRKVNITNNNGEIVYKVEYVCNENIARFENIYMNMKKK